MDIKNNDKWIRLGEIRKNDKGNQYALLGMPKSSYQPCTVELVVKDAAGNIIASLENPLVQVRNPRKRPEITEEQLARIPEYVMAEIVLPPPKKTA